MPRRRGTVVVPEVTGAQVTADSGNGWPPGPTPLPVEVADYRREYPKLGWVVAGRRDSGEITIEIARNPLEQEPIKPYTWFNRTVETVLGRPYRPSNHDVKYERRRYSSAHPFVLDGPLDGVATN